MKETSILAYVGILETIGNRQLEVIKAINEIQPCSDLDIAEHLRKPINTITPRRNELVKLGLVYGVYVGISKQTGRKVTFWRFNKK